MAVLASKRVAMVATEIHRALTGVISADTKRCDATREQRAASEHCVGARETALLSLATVAVRDDWSRAEIDDGTATALSRRNSKDNSVATFAAEIKRACHPSARSHVAALASLCTEAWDVEGESAKDYPRQCRKAFARRYHMLVATLREAIDGRVFASRQEIVRWAVTCDPDRDPVKVLRRVQAIHGQLKALVEAWPHSELAASAQALGRVTLDGLKALVPPTPKAAMSAPANDVAPEVDILDEALGALVSA